MTKKYVLKKHLFAVPVWFTFCFHYPVHYLKNVGHVLSEVSLGKHMHLPNFPSRKTVIYIYIYFTVQKILVTVNVT